MKKWIDKQALILAIILSVIIWVGSIGACIRALQDGRILVAVAIFSIVTFIYLAHGHWLPIRIKDNKIFLSRGSFPSFGQTKIPFAEIKSIHISKAKKWDELPGRPGLKMNFVRATDISGRKYRNIIISKEQFAEAIYKLIENSVINKELRTNIKFLREAPNKYSN